MTASRRPQPDTDRRPGLTAVALAMLCLASPLRAEPPPWPVAEKAAAISVCRLVTAQRLEADFLRRSGLQSIPDDVRPRFERRLLPALDSCDCAFGHIEQEWTYEYFLAHQQYWPSRVSELATGPCATRQYPVP